ncbi:hypothetical protein ACHAPU_010796 [Fusarium lateritium]
MPPNPSTPERNHPESSVVTPPLPSPYLMLASRVQDNLRRVWRIYRQWPMEFLDDHKPLHFSQNLAAKLAQVVTKANENDLSVEELMEVIKQYNPGLISSKGFEQVVRELGGLANQNSQAPSPSMESSSSPIQQIVVFGPEEENQDARVLDNDVGDVNETAQEKLLDKLEQEYHKQDARRSTVNHNLNRFEDALKHYKVTSADSMAASKAVLFLNQVVDIQGIRLPDTLNDIVEAAKPNATFAKDAHEKAEAPWSKLKEKVKQDREARQHVEDRMHALTAEISELKDRIANEKRRKATAELSRNLERISAQGLGRMTGEQLSEWNKLVDATLGNRNVNG